MIATMPINDLPYFFIEPQQFSYDSHAEPSSSIDIDRQYIKGSTNPTITWQRKDLLAFKIEEIFSECRDLNWDGNNADPISNSVVNLAKKIVSLIPSYLPAADLSPEADGEIALEWQKNDRLFSVSIGENNQLSFAGIFGQEGKIHGNERYNNELPSAILDGIKRVVQHS